jgi:hypothetical protein
MSFNDLEQGFGAASGARNQQSRNKRHHAYETAFFFSFY